MTTKINVDSRTILERLRVHHVSCSRATECMHPLKTKRINKQNKREEKEQSNQGKIGKARNYTEEDN